MDKLRTDSLIKTYMASSSIRPEVLFRHFLPVGYRSTTLSSVPTDSVDAVVFAKTHLGMIITLYDDLADHPQYRHPELLRELYKLNVGQDCKTPDGLLGEDHKIFELARFLFFGLTQVLKGFRHFSKLAPVLRFDVEQFYACNRHSELMGILPAVRNLTETRILGAHNMGIVGAGTIDLMASSQFKIEELGQCREIFLLGQRMGRISNLIFTLKREISEGDFTNEILIAGNLESGKDYASHLHAEFQKKLGTIQTLKLKTFSTSKYAKGILDLHELYASLEGEI